jgi:hypothetical protein
MAERTQLRRSPPDRALAARAIAPAAAAIGRQIAELVADPQSDFFTLPPPGYQRGIDFYPGSHLLKVIAIAAHRYRDVHGRYPNLLRPELLTEKILWSNYFRLLQPGQAGNKLATGSFLPAEIDEPVAVPAIAWRSASARLPPANEIEPGIYYLKTNHGSDMFRRIAWPPNDDERGELETEFAGHLRRAYGYWSGEWWYSCFEREIFLERSVAAEEHPIAWCCYTFGGTVGLIIAYRKTDRGSETAWLNPDFTPQGWQNPAKPRTEFALPPIGVRDAMLKAAGAIGRAHSFVRVDFLIGDDGRLYLSELTFSPGNGLTPWPEELDRKIGAYWTLDPNVGPKMGSEGA